MRKAILIVIIIVVTVPIAIYVWATQNVQNRLYRKYTPPALGLDHLAGDLALGQRIVEVRNGCVDCHGKNLEGKMVIDDPAMGKIYGPNITPSAIGDWTDGEIALAIRNGIRRDGTPLLMMPSHEYHRLSKSDVQSLIRYLRSVPPVTRNPIPMELGPLAKALIASGKLPTFIPAEIIDHEAGFPAKPDETVSVEFGRYLIESSCVGCHKENLTGGPIAGGPPDWPPASNISGQALVSWSESDFIKAMREGISPGNKKIRLPMPINLTSKMNDLELKAMWAYISNGS